MDDIDHVTSTVLSSGFLLLMLLAAALDAVPYLAGPLSGVDASAAELALALGLAALVVPVLRHVRRCADRSFFGGRFAVEPEISQVLRDASGCDTARALLTRVGDALDALLCPDSSVIYSYNNAGRGYAPVFVRGCAVPRAFPAGAALVSTLAERRTPLALEDAHRTGRWALTPFDRAALETLGANVVVPVHQRAQLSAFLCLGAKRSGDAYTSTDLALLVAVGERISSALDRFDQPEVRCQITVVQEEHEGVDREEKETGTVGQVLDPLETRALIEETLITTPAAPPDGDVFRKEGEYWTITFERCVTRLKDAKGLSYIAHLLRNPGRELHVCELMAQLGKAPGMSNGIPEGQAGDLRIRTSISGRGAALLDVQAKAVCKLRLDDLREGLDEAERFNDAGRVARYREEIELITDQMAAAFGLGGGGCVAASAAERARLAVTKRIKAALTKIRAANPALARHLSGAITTGYFCSYAPKADPPTSWSS